MRRIILMITVMAAMASIGFALENDEEVYRKTQGQVPWVEIECSNDPSAQTVTMDFTVSGDATDGEIVYELYPPYTPYSGTVSGTSGTVTLNALPVPQVRGTAYWRKLSGRDAPQWSPKTEEFGGDDGCPTGFRDVWDYVCDAWWLIAIGFLAVMSYRFFSGRAMDYQDYFDEFRGKK